MRNEFIETANVNKFNQICQELGDPASLVGPSLAMVTGPAGRGKSEAAKHFAVHHGAVYIPPLNIRTPPMVLREVVLSSPMSAPSAPRAASPSSARRWPRSGA